MKMEIITKVVILMVETVVWDLMEFGIIVLNAFVKLSIKLLIKL